MVSVPIWGRNRNFTQPTNPLTAVPLTDGLESLCGGAFTPFALDYILQQITRCLDDLTGSGGGLETFIENQFQEFQSNYFFADYATKANRPDNTFTPGDPLTISTPNTNGTYRCILSAFSQANVRNGSPFVPIDTTPVGIIPEQFASFSGDGDSHVAGLAALDLPGNSTFSIEIDGSIALFGVRIDGFNLVGSIS